MGFWTITWLFFLFWSGDSHEKRRGCSCSSLGVQMHLLNLYGLFSVIFSSEFFSLIMHTYPRKCTCIRRPTKEKVPRGAITCSEIGKQNVQAKKYIDCRFWSRLGLCMKSCKMWSKKKRKRRKKQKRKTVRKQLRYRHWKCYSSYLTICFRMTFQN